MDAQANVETITPFFERLPWPLPENFIGKILVSAGLGLAFFAVRSASTGFEASHDWSWLLAALISITMLCIYYGTHVLRTTVAEMNSRLLAISAMDLDRDENPRDDDRPAAAGKVDMIDLTGVLSNRNFVLAGLCLGILNAAFAYRFGIPDTETAAIFSIEIGHFLAGFVVGLGIPLLYGVCDAVPTYSCQAPPSFEFTSPDGCGGTLFLGEALVVISSITLVTGVMISVNMLKIEWTVADTWSVLYLKRFWIGVPYLLSVGVLIAPAVSLNRALTAYKKREEASLQRRLTGIRRKLDTSQWDAGGLKDLREDYEFVVSERAKLDEMRTWPYGLGTNLRYLFVFSASASATIETVLNWTPRIAPNFFQP
jgi:hypothetical protein